MRNMALLLLVALNGSVVDAENRDASKALVNYTRF